MSQTVQTKEKQPERETSEQNSQDIPVTSQNITTNDLEIETLYSDEYNNFKCPICLDILRSTRITKSCFHRFCKDCIITALRLGNKECPVCRTKLNSKRSLNPDPQLDELIRKMFPRCNEKDSSQKKPLGKRKYKTHRTCSLTNETGQEITITNSVHHGKDHLDKTTSGLESNNDSLPCCSNTSTQSSKNAGPNNKRAKTTEFEHDS
uniref:E3 ubiquitin-protein ligase RING2-like n=1 Tax=Arvicanthis niloticus TaxID=61156 RepID=UPI0014861372|nr:E3 ubiquitin-protein ligase RING2-like [Arvicanthis niloticus]